MTTFIKRKLKKSDDKTNIDKYNVAAYVTEYQFNLPQNHLFKNHDDKTIRYCM